MSFFAEPTTGLVDKAILEVVNAYRTERTFTKIENSRDGADGPLPVIIAN